MASTIRALTHVCECLLHGTSGVGGGGGGAI